MTGKTRQNIFRLKRSNVSGKIPTTSQLLVGEMAVNTQDGFLYSTIADIGGTNTVEVRQIGWDRLSTLSGGTVNGDVTINGSLSATTLSGDGGGITNVGLRTKSGEVAGATFLGVPRKATITFTTNFPTSNYSISVLGGDNRTFTYESRTVSGFTINANSAAVLTNPVLWMAIQHGEY